MKRRSATPGYDAIILAGGRGERLGGVDKALIEVRGQSLLGYATSAASDARHVVVVGTPRSGFGHVAWTSEQPPGGGPAAGVIAGMAA
ncbi:MAG: NTP transferase domain-containing protein, partial [Ornithinimicrobium sp.]